MSANKAAPAPIPAPRMKASARKAFLNHLAETSNVAASARKVDISKASIYAERRRLPEFRAAWGLALAEGYARLEAEMLYEALKPASAKTSDAMLKAKAQKQRLQITLLQMHRASVKAAPPALVPAPASEAGSLKLQLLTRIRKMRSSQKDIAPRTGHGGGSVG